MNKKDAYINQVLVNGMVYYKDGSPGGKAVIMIEEYTYCMGEQIGEQKKEIIANYYTTSNKEGKFNFMICNLNHYYKIEVFEGIIEMESSPCSCSVYL